MMQRASFTTSPSSLWTMSRLFSSSMKSETWISRPCPFFMSFCSPKSGQVLQDPLAHFLGIKSTVHTMLLPCTHLCGRSSRPGTLRSPFFHLAPTLGQHAPARTHSQSIPPSSFLARPSRGGRYSPGIAQHLVFHDHPYTRPFSTSCAAIPT